MPGLNAAMHGRKRRRQMLEQAQQADLRAGLRGDEHVAERGEREEARAWVA